MGLELVSVVDGSWPQDETPTLHLIDPASDSSVQPVGFTGKTLVFSDEFEAGSLDTLKWDPFYPDTEFWNATTPGGHLTNTNEPQGYDISAISFDGSVMKFTMRDEETVTGLPFTSGMVCSYKSFNQTYGYFEAKLRFPAEADGLWGGFWMDPTDMVWPPEIDIVENFGGGSFYAYKASYIPPAPDSQSSTQIDQWPVGPADPTHFHVYGCLWEHNRVRFYYDGAMVKDYSNANVSAKDMYLLCNLAGRQPKNGSSVPSLPITMEVDYIRAWA